MVKTFVRVAFTAAAAAAVFVVVGGSPSAAQDKGLSIKDIMKAGHAGADALMKQATTAAKNGKWDDATAAAKSLDSNAALLAKAAAPGKSDPASWEKLGGAYHKNTSALLAATEKKDAAGVSKAAGALGMSCSACHKGHKGK